MKKEKSNISLDSICITAKEISKRLNRINVLNSLMSDRNFAENDGFADILNDMRNEEYLRIINALDKIKLSELEFIYYWSKLCQIGL